MKKRLAALILAICMVAAYVPAGAVTLPASLTEIEAEAFRGDSSMTGVVTLPADVARVGDDAFTGTGLYALIIPESAAYVGTQVFGHAAYVRVNGAATQVRALSGVRCVLAPAGSPALAAASGADAVPLEELVTQDGFLYRAQGDALTLLCAEDPAAVGASVAIPEEVGGKPVSAISGYAFIGCTSLTTISLPVAVKASVTPGATADCPAAVISYYGDEGGDEPGEVIVNGVTADVTAGASGNSITWHVDAEAGEGASYTYTVERNGTEVATETSDEATFVYEAEGAGAYRLFVTVTGRSGSVATGASAVLYIAVEAMVMTVPESIEAGANLVINVSEVENAQGYTLYVTNEQTGELVKKLTPTEAGDVTVDGYLLASGEYRVSGYVHGNDFRYTVPTVRNVTVTGTAADGPVIPAQEPLVVNNACMIDFDGEEPFVIRHQLRSADNTLTGYTYARSEASGAAGVYSYIYADGYQGGGMILVQASMQVDGKWTAWGPVTEITLNAKPVMDAPVVTCPETVQAGADFTISFTAVEDAAWYMLSFVSDATGESWGMMNQYSSAQTLYISGATHNLSAGSYTVQIQATTSDFSVSSTGTAKMTITGTRPAAPSVTLSPDVFTLDDCDVVVTVNAPGYDAASVGNTILNTSDIRTQYNLLTVSQLALTDGTGSKEWFAGLGEWADGMYYVAYAFVYADGVWSEPGVAAIPIRKPEPLDAAVITAPETLLAGENLNFSFDAVEGAESYEAHLYSAASVGGSVIKWYSDVQPGTVNTYAGYNLAEGVYCIRVTASSAAQGSSTSDHYFTVTGTKPAAPAVTCDSDVAYVGGKANFTIDTTGAEAIRIEGAATRDLTPSGDETTWSYTFSSLQADTTVTFRFTVKRDGVWSQWATITFDVLAEKPVEPPTLTCPETILAGANLNVNIAAAEGTTHYQLYIYRGYTVGAIPTGSTNRVYSYSSSASPTILHGYDMNLEAGEYTVVAGAYVDGRWGYCAAKLTVTGARPAAPAVTVDKTSVLPSEKYAFTISTPDAELVHCYERDSSGSGSLDTLAVLEDVTVWQDYKSREEVFTYTFTTFRDGQWSQWSEPVVITVSNSLPGPEISVPASVALGCDVKVSVAETAAATRYSVNVRNSNGLQIIRQNADTLTDGGFLFEGYHFAPGTYTVEVEYYNGVGWSNVSEANFTVVNGTRPDAPAAMADSDTGYIGVAIGFDVPVTGAQKAAVRYYRLGDPDDVTYKTLEVTADSLRWTDYKYTAGDTWNYAFAVQVDGVWSPWSTTLPVTISARQQLAQPVVACPDTAQAGTDVVYTFGAVQNADSYSVVLVRPDGSTRSWTGYPGNEMTLPGYDLNPGSYQLKITASGAGYDSNTAVHALAVTGTRADAPAVVLDKNAVFTGGTYTFVIENGACEQIAWKYATDAGGSNSGTLNVLADVTVWETSASWAGVQSYSFCVLKDGAWSAWSEPIAVTISQRPALPEPVVTLPETAQKGVDLIVAFETVEGASYYYVDLYTIYGQNVLSRYMQEAGSLTVLGCSLPDSYVRVQVTAYGENGGVSKTSKTLRVVSATLPEAPAVTGPANGMVPDGSRAVFTVDTSGVAVEMAAVRYYRVGDPNNVTITTFAVTGDATEWKDYTRDVGSTWAYAFAVQTGGVWSAWSAEVRVETVEALPIAPSDSWYDGVYTASATGMGGGVTVQVTIHGGVMTDVQVLSHNETPGIGTPALESIPGKIVTSGSADVDAVAGATVTSNAIMEAVRLCLQQAAEEPAVTGLVIAAKETYAAGENIDFSIGPVEGAEGYWWVLYRDGESGSLDSNNDGVNPTALEISIPGYREYLTVGDYRLVVNAYTDSATISSGETTFTITGTRPDAPSVTCDAEIVWVGMSAAFTIDAEGAEEYRGGLRQSGGMHTLSGSGPAYSYSFSEDQAGETLNFCFCVMQDGLWSQWAEVTRTVLAEEPLPVPEVTAPTALRRGEDLVFCFQSVPDAVDYNVTIRRADGTIDTIRYAVDYPSEENRVYGFDLQPGENTLIVAAAFADGSQTVTEKTFTVSSEPLPTAPAVTVNKTVVTSDEYPVFTIDTTGADKFYFISDGYIGESSATGERSQWMPPFVAYSGATFRFRVRMDGVWSEQSEPIAVTISDALPAPELTVADPLTLGRDLVVTVGEVEGERYYNVVLCDASGQSLKYLYPDGPGSIAIYGCYFQQGIYTIKAYTSNSEIAEATVTVTAPGTRPAAPTVTAESTEVVMDDPLPFIIDVTGADMITMRIGDSGAFDPIAVSGSGTFRWPVAAFWEGWNSYSFAVRVNGVWSPFSEPILVNTVPAVTLPLPAIDMPETLTAGHELVVRVAAVEGAEDYTIILYDPQGQWINDQYVSSSTGATFTFPGYLMSPGTYEIVLSIGGHVDGVHVNNTTYAGVTVTAGNQPAAPAVTAETEYTLSGSSYAFTIDTTGADKVAVRCMAPDMTMPAASHQELTATGGSTTWTHSYSGPDSMQVKYFFSVCVDGVWSPWSETHTVTIVDELPVQPPVITCAESFLAGEDIVFTAEAPEGVVGCSWQIVSGETVLEGEFADGASVTLSALEYDLAAGDYLLTVTATLGDGNTSQAEHVFAVTGTRPEGPRITLGKYCVEPGESTTLTVSVPGASKAYFYCRTTGEVFLLDVTDGQAVCTFSTDVKRDCYIRAAALYGTQWSAMGSQALLVVEYPLADPVVSVPESIVLGSDLVVSVEPVVYATNCYVEVYTGAGSYIARINADPAGGDFVISGELLTTTGPYKIRVVASNSWYGVESELSTVYVVPD